MSSASYAMERLQAQVKERPILFSGLMVRALLAGKKTQTRRIVKPQPVPFVAHDEPGPFVWFDRQFRGLQQQGRVREAELAQLIAPLCPYGAPGDRLWVRETWKPWPNTAGAELRGPNGDGAIYKATWDKSGGHHWKPSIHMPRWASRLTLEITGVRVERVQDISEADAEAEGASERFVAANHRNAFECLWNLINAERGHTWETNPWVWVVEFRTLPFA
jgi:hypothetical protein